MAWEQLRQWWYLRTTTDRVGLEWRCPQCPTRMGLSAPGTDIPPDAQERLERFARDHEMSHDSACGRGICAMNAGHPGPCNF